MENKAEILTVTNYGLDIYAHILREYYPNETVMQLSGRDCGLCRNPFAGGEHTLHIWIEKSNPDDSTSDELARHHDTTDTIPDGDAFTFAEQHYHLTGEDLLAKLAENLHLVRKSESTDNENTGTPVFSFFCAPVSNTHPLKDYTLLDAYLYIIGSKAKKRTDDLRAISDKEQAKRFKSSSFDFCCFSGTFAKRNTDGLIKHSGLMCIDFDHIPDPESLRQNLLFDEYFDTQLMFRSPSGDGIKWIVSVDLSEFSHGDYFDAVAAYILQNYGIQIDKSGRDVCRACFLPYDSHAYINPQYLSSHGQESI